MEVFVWPRLAADLSFGAHTACVFRDLPCSPDAVLSTRPASLPDALHKTQLCSSWALPKLSRLYSQAQVKSSLGTVSDSLEGAPLLKGRASTWIQPARPPQRPSWTELLESRCVLKDCYLLGVELVA